MNRDVGAARGDHAAAIEAATVAEAVGAGRRMGFSEACGAVVRHLERAVPMGYWSISRYDGTDQLYLAVRDSAYGKIAGDRHRWDSSLCQYSTSGAAPLIAPDAMAVPAYAAARIAAEIPIGSYIGIPVRRANGELFGTICGLDPDIKSAELEAHAPLLETIAVLLGIILEADLGAADLARRLDVAEALAATDELTGCANRRGWGRALDLEEARFRRFGDPGAVVVIDLDGLKVINDTRGHAAGDGHIRAAGDVLSSSVRDGDLVARLGGDEFGMLVTDATPAQVTALAGRLQLALADAGVGASIGHAPFTFAGGLRRAWAAADAAMYEVKRRRRQGSVSAAGAPSGVGAAAS
jgi:diguanylate cyclase